jgi:hypothetical protein
VAVGIFVGLFYLSEDPSFTLKIVTFTALGCVGRLAFIRHILFYKSDVQKMGWEISRAEINLLENFGGGASRHFFMLHG